MLRLYSACKRPLFHLLILAIVLAVFTVHGQLASKATISLANGTAILRWQGTSGVKYRVERCTELGAAWQGIDAATTACSVTNLVTSPAAFYRVVVWSNAYPADLREPPTVGSITFNTLSFDRVTLAWPAVTESGADASGTLEYLIYRGGNFLKSVPHTAGATTISAEDANLIAAQTYGYQVAVMDRAGNVSARSAVANVTLPTGACTYTLNSTSASLAAGAQSGSFGVMAAAGCAWSAVAGPTWIHTSSSGSGNGTVYYTLDANGSPSPRSGAITVNGRTFYVSQSAATTVDHEVPTATFGAPTQGAALSGQVPIQVRLTDNVSLAGAEFYIDHAGSWRLLGTSPSSGVVFTNVFGFDTTAVPNGPHSLLCMAYDTAGNKSSALVLVTVANVLTDPGVSLFFREIARPASDWEAVAHAVKADGQGNLVAVGNFTGTVNFGPFSKTSVGGSDVFICKYDPTGNLLWLRTYGGSSADGVANLAIDASGNVLITGGFSGTADFGGGPMTSAAGIFGSDVFVAKYSSTGTHLWSKRFGGRYGNNSGADIAVDSAGNVVVAGMFYSEADLGGGLILSRAGGLDGFVAKYSGQTGGFIWGKDFGGSGSDYAKGVAVDSLGDVVVVGYGYGTLNLGGAVLAHAGSADLFLAKYAGGDGRYLWSRVAGGSGPDTAEGVAVDANRNIFVTGGYAYSLSLGGITVNAPVATAVYLAKYDAGGNAQWVRNLGYETPGGAIGSRAVAVDSAGNAVLSGNASGAVNFGNGVATYGESDFFLAKYDPLGGYLWAKRSINVGQCGGASLTIDRNRNVISTGFIQGEVSVDGLAAASPGQRIKSAFLLKISP